MEPQPEFDFDAVFDVDDYIYFYEDSLTEERSEAEVAGLVKIAELDTPLKILDIPCGMGRHTIRLAALGHIMTGIDLYPGFLDIARKEASIHGVQVDFRQGDMRYLDLEAQFDRVMMLFTSYGYFEDDDNFHVLENVARALVPGGLFVLDIPNRDIFMKNMPPVFIVEKNNDLMIDRLSFDTRTGRMYNNRIVIRDGVRKDKPFFVRHFSLSEITSWLKQAGLETVQTYEGYGGEPFKADSRRIIVVAKRLP